jgi:hypothetical protein
MSDGRSTAPGILSWSDLAGETRMALEGKLKGLFGWQREDEIFDSLSVDKQQALLILLKRFQELGLWDAVRRVTNVYGEGGVGMDFAAWPVLRSRLDSRRDFTRRFAAHRNNSGGFLEWRKGGKPTLHLVYLDGGERRWAAHFDLYNPFASPLNALRHLYHEKLRGELPNWRQIGLSLWKSA